MSEGIKRMLAEREARNRSLNEDCPLFAAGIERIRAARTKLDAGRGGNTWKPSELLVIGYCALATGSRPASANDFLASSLTHKGV